MAWATAIRYAGARRRLAGPCLSLARRARTEAQSHDPMIAMVADSFLISSVIPTTTSLQQACHAAVRRVGARGKFKSHRSHRVPLWITRYGAFWSRGAESWWIPHLLVPLPGLDPTVLLDRLRAAARASQSRLNSFCSLCY